MPIGSAAFAAGASPAVVVDGTEWRQLTTTVDFTWNEVAAACGFVPTAKTPAYGGFLPVPARVVRDDVRDRQCVRRIQDGLHGRSKRYCLFGHNPGAD